MRAEDPGFARVREVQRGSIGEYKPRSGCSPLHGGCAWMRTGHSTQRARAAKHLGGKMN